MLPMYFYFHIQLAIKMDALEQYLKIEKMDASEITENAIKHKQEKWSEVSNNYTDVESQGKDFIKRAGDVSLHTCGFYTDDLVSKTNVFSFVLQIHHISLLIEYNIILEQ